ncbi:helix-turn-helix transcriptional regulator [Catenuloplanes atrovinosus]|uniref:DNA-binding CsgD family transcriptional regulator n=1 Tax=Catenuloplanes atrovinosus TaxID=137266 RepID=A0AAE4C9J9_9ACTN|nr:LuxR C-terminal-related transcriptional regulator [Catenuloplanes atrovinosus]MDR7274874.1 DNA-binding CsgD family transcriptional regulator [Catenuloplanes atrovinosus]
MTPTERSSKHRLRQSFAGREDELRRIATAMSQSWCAGLALTGDRGTGKSRLLAEAADAADPATHLVVRATATPGVRLGAFAEHLPPSLLTAPFDGDTLRLAADALLAAAGRRRLVLAVDDAGRLDEASAALALRMARRGEAFLLTTVDRGRRLPHPLAEPWTLGHAEWMEVGPLDREAVERVLADTLPGALDGLLVQRFWEATAGNALLLRELITAQLAAGRLRTRDGMWRMTGDFAVPPWLAALVEERMAALPADARTALELLAHVEPMRPEVLGELVPAAALEAAEAHALIRVERETVRLTYPVHGDVLRATTPRLRARRWRAETAALLERHGAAPAELARAAAWRLADHRAPDPATTAAAARGALVLRDLRLAADLAGRAAAAGTGTAAAEPLGYGLLYTGRAAEAERSLAALGRPDDPADRARLAAVRAFTLFFGLGRDGAADALLRTAEAEAPEGRWRTRLPARRALLRACAGDHHGALRLAAGVPDEPEARLAHGLAQVFTGRPAEGIEALRRDWPDDAPWLPVLAGVGIVHGLLWSGRIAEADAAARTAYEHALEQRWAYARAVSCLLRAVVAHTRGLTGEQLHRCREGIAIARRHGPDGLLGALLGLLAHGQALAGDAHEAPRTLAEADRLAGPSTGMLRPWTDLARLWVTTATRRDPIPVAHAAWQRAADRGTPGPEAMILHALVRLGAPGHATDRLAALAGTAGSPLVTLYAAHARASADGDAGALATVSAAFEELGTPLPAAEAAAEESVRHRAAGRLALASAATARALVLARRCGATPPGTALGRLETPQITRREAEVASLACHGLSSKEIGVRLVVSVRTVENHLHRVYRKFGINTRAELRRLGVLLTEAHTG